MHPSALLKQFVQEQISMHAPGSIHIEGTAFLHQLVEMGRDLIEEPGANPEYERGILELLTDATGTDLPELRQMMFPPRDPVLDYAAEIIGDEATTAQDWQRVARSLYDELGAMRRWASPEREEDPAPSMRHEDFPAPFIRRCDFYPHKANPEDPDPTYRHRCDVVMRWTKDADGAPRMEHGHGETAAEAYQMARAIAAAFMFEETVGPEEWPKNKIDQQGGYHLEG